MEPVYLINKGNFAAYKTISKGVDLERIEQFILEAQDQDLKSIMCRPFFFDVLKNYQVDKYQKLIHGEEYTDANENVIQFQGLKPVLVHFAHALYVMRGDIQDTATIMGRKKNEFSDGLTPVERRDIYTRSRQVAMTYWNEVLYYLKKKENDFLVWKNKCGCSTSSRLKIDRI